MGLSDRGDALPELSKDLWQLVDEQARILARQILTGEVPVTDWNTIPLPDVSGQAGEQGGVVQEQIRSVTKEIVVAVCKAFKITDKYVIPGNLHNIVDSMIDTALAGVQGVRGIAREAARSRKRVVADYEADVVAIQARYEALQKEYDVFFKAQQQRADKQKSYEEWLAELSQQARAKLQVADQTTPDQAALEAAYRAWNAKAEKRNAIMQQARTILASLPDTIGLEGLETFKRFIDLVAEVDLAREEADDQLDALDACLTDFGQGIDINDRLQQLEAGMRERMTSGEIRMPHQLEARECLRYYEKTVAVQAARQVLELPSVDVQVQLRQAETMVGFIDAIGMPRDIGVLGTDAIEYIVAAVLAADRGQTAERPDAGSNDPIAIGRLVRDLRTTGIYALERFGEQSDWKKKIEELIIFLFAHREQLWPDAERNLQGHIAVLVQQVQTEIAQYSYKQKKPAQYALSDALARAGRVVRQ